MSDLPLLTLLMVVPLVGAVVVAVAPRAFARQIALGVSLLTLVVALAAWAAYDPAGAQFQLTEQHSWIPQFGVSYALGVDGIALALIVMGAILAPVCLLAAWRDLDDDHPKLRTYFALMLVLEAFMLGVFAATDVFLFYVLFEAMLVPVYFLIGQFGGARRRYAAMKFLLYSLAGGLIMLVAVIGVYVVGPGGSDGFVVQNLIGNIDASEGVQRWLFVGFFIAFAIKAPMVPVHTWLPDAAQAARPATSVLLVGVLDKVGTFGMIRFCLQLFPEASKWATPVVIVLAVISVIYGALLAIAQTDMMRLIAFSSVSHFGFIVLGIFALTSTAGAGSSLYMVNHGFTTAALFLLAGFLAVRNHGSTRISDYGGWQRTVPVLAGLFLIANLSGLSLPGLGSFVSEFLVVVGTYQRYQVAAVIAVFGTLLAALYMLLMYQRVFTGPRPTFADEASRPRDLVTRERVVLVPVIAAFLLLGFYPKPVLDVVNPAVKQVLTSVGATDPTPTIATGSAK